MSKCANCGKPLDNAKHILTGDSMYDGEWCCSNECLEEHDRLGCPLESKQGYRKRKETD